MSRPRQADANTLRTLLQARDQATALELAEELKVSRPTVSRLLTELGDEVVRIGAARQARYSLRRVVGTLGNSWPIHRVDGRGELQPAGRLEAVKGGFRLSEVPPILRKDYPEGFFSGLPFYFDDLRPQGFLGRVQTRRVANTLGVSQDSREWLPEHTLSYLLHYGDDLPGDLIIGEEMAARVRRGELGADPSSLTVSVPAGLQNERYPELSELIIRGESFGSSAGGEQPKFATWVIDEGNLPRAVLVKFSPVMTTQAGRRWADLLLAESHALDVLREVGVAAAPAKILEAGTRRFLEVTRYDRVGARGRRGMVSLLSLDAGVIEGKNDTWVDSANAMETAGLLTTEDARLLRRLWCFGVLIGNNDMHRGNISFWWREEPPFALAPVYDMLPMGFGPNSQGELVTRELSFPEMTETLRADWEVAARWALDFWARVLADGRFSPDFAVLAQAMRQRVVEFVSGPPAVETPAPAFATRYPNVAQALEEQKKKSDSSLRGPEGNQAKVKQELAAILAANEDLWRVAKALFPEGPKPVEFAAFSLDAYHYLGVGDEVRAFMGKLWLDVIRRWAPAEQGAFLAAVIVDKRQIFEALDFISGVFNHISFSAEVMLPWLQSARQKLGNDLYQRGFWNSVAAFSERSPSEAVEVANRWLAQDPDDTSRSVIARILGWVRLALREGDPVQTPFAAMEKRLRGQGRPEWRALYLESWARSGGALTEGRALQLRDELANAGPLEMGSWCFLLGTIIQTEPMARKWAFREMTTVASPALESTARYWITVASMHAWEEFGEADGVTRAQWEELILAVMPFKANEGGLWNRVDNFLREVAQRAPERMVDLVRKIAAKNGSVWLDRVTGHVSEGFIAALREYQLQQGVATGLCLGTTVAERKMGLAIFSQAFVDKLEPTAFEAASAKQIELVFREAQRGIMETPALGRLHASLAGRMKEMDPELVDDFYGEVRVQAMNTHGYRAALQAAAQEEPKVKEAIEQVEALLKRLAEVAVSPALQMQVPGYVRAEHSFNRRFSREVAKGMHKHSVFLQMVKRVQLLYGNNWRMQQHAGGISPASALKETSHSIEMPRMEFMDPEGLRWRRIAASKRINDLDGED